MVVDEASHRSIMAMQARIAKLEAMVERAVEMLTEHELFHSEEDMLAAAMIADEAQALLKVGER